ncbi:hypothetical protein TrST_g5453 [Triparma strigata]|uniref:UDP-N-acetylglucosamine transferase subunit ALG14 n=1 Tax=Triparma strigata TaxID=1606541 RepID=A0A9W7CA78_9STRA|nr:hypothetical protein TrST_g5453 [Triparma strigata]
MTPTSFTSVMYLCTLTLLSTLFFFRLLNLFLTILLTANPNKITVSLFYGSGGHTTELLILSKVLNLNSPTTANRFNLIKYCGTDDARSLKIINSDPQNTHSHHLLPRSRSVLQSWSTTPFTALYSLTYSLFKVTWMQLTAPSDVFLSNGPGTGLVLMVCFKISNVVLGTRTRVIYVESWCRVERLSLTGRLGRFFVDRFCVCWEGVKGEGRVLLDNVMFEKEGEKGEEKRRIPTVHKRRIGNVMGTVFIGGVWCSMVFLFKAYL